MNEYQYQAYQSLSDPAAPTISLSDLFDRTPRTLLFGYDVDRVTHHVYVMDNLIYLSKYSLGNPLDSEAHFTWEASKLVPNKRAYVESTDLDFATAILRRGLRISFTTPDYPRHAFRLSQRGGVYAGKTE